MALLSSRGGQRRLEHVFSRRLPRFHDAVSFGGPFEWQPPADEWNAMFISPQTLREMNMELDDVLELCGRRSDDLRRTVMQGVEVDSQSEGSTITLRQRLRSSSG